MDTNLGMENPKMMVSSSKNKQTNRQTATPLKIKGHRIRLEIGTDTKINTGNPKMTVPKVENNGNHTQRPTPNLFNLDFASNGHVQIIF